ncbi:MAG: diacylglycerol kinase [Desulfobulbaceae bacterium]|nr:diacylglycerol kinase [Desulfobulbaceae bacterium]
MAEKPDSRTGLARIIAAWGYSWAGLSFALRRETPFRQECLLYLILLAGLPFLPLPGLYKLVLLALNSLVLIVELLNSAIEKVVDLASPNYHHLAKQAKDLGSAAVLLSLLLALVGWLFALAQIGRDGWMS